MLADVLTTYRITRLSNPVVVLHTFMKVLTTYRITRLSNLKFKSVKARIDSTAIP